jgi:hypothetical protein
MAARGLKPPLTPPWSESIFQFGRVELARSTVLIKFGNQIKSIKPAGLGALDRRQSLGPSGGATYPASHGGRQTFPPTNPPTPTSLSPADRQSSVLRRRHGCWDSLTRR